MSLQVRITKKDLSAFKKDAQKFVKRKLQAVDLALDATALEIAGDAKKNLDSNKTTDRGILKNSITIRNTSQGDNKRRRVGTNAGYGKWVEFGRPPGSAPPKKIIEEWVRRKIKPPQADLGSVTFLVQRAIKERGTKAQPFLGPAFNKNKRTLQRALKKAYKLK